MAARCVRICASALWWTVALTLAPIDRADAQDADLITAAKKEGTVTWYSALTIDQIVRPAADAFEKKYGIKVNYVRSDSSMVALRIHEEAQAGKVQADVFDGTAAVAALKKENLVLKWVPEITRTMSKDYYDADGYWVTTSLYVLAPGYNTDLVPKGTEPHSLDELLDPKWRGKMAWGSSPSTSSGPGFVGLVLDTLGEKKGNDYLRKLAGQNIANLAGSARQILDQVIAGEYALALNMFTQHAVISAAKGAPVNWIPMRPETGVLSPIAITRAAPHPNAGKLLIDYLMSEEGQQVFRNNNYIPVNPKVPALDPGLRNEAGAMHARFFTPEQIDVQMPGWVEVYNRYFR